MGSEGGHIQVTLDEALLGGEMAALNDLRPGKYAVVEVKDNGCGMDEQTRRRIFEPLFTTKAENSGTGLGLAVAHGIARAHEGAILVESKQGVGTTFRVAIPAVEVDLADEPAPMSAAPATKAALGVRVLYIDDDAVMCLTVGRLLERNGFIVKCEEDPAAAIATLKSEPRAFDVVVSDFNMPRHSGLDVLREALAVRPDMPTILTSGNISAELEEQAEHLGVRRLLEKQFTFEQLCPAIAAVAGSSASTRPQNLTAPTT
jgi:CheY-like chemotaxis protein